MIGKKLLYVVMGGAVALALLVGAAVSFAQTDGVASAATSGSAAPLSSLVLIHNGGRGGPAGSEQALADALGIDLTELEAAEEAARVAMIDQAVADGLLTEAQAEQLKADGGFGRGFRPGYDMSEYLADALLAELETQTFNFGFGGRGGHGGHGGRGGHGGPGGFGLDTLPDTAPETVPDTTTDTSFDA